MELLVQWIHRLADIDPTRAGAQPSWIYVALCVAVPAIVGALIALLITFLERRLGSRLGAPRQTGH